MDCLQGDALDTSLNSGFANGALMSYGLRKLRRPGAWRRERVDHKTINVRTGPKNLPREESRSALEATLSKSSTANDAPTRCRLDAHCGFVAPLFDLAQPLAFACSTPARSFEHV